jgi:hypothetical protein
VKIELNIVEVVPFPLAPYQIEHLVYGFIGDPIGHLNFRPNSGKLIIIPLILYAGMEMEYTQID